MPTTTTKGVPYPLGGDAASSLDTTIQTLAEWVDARPGIAQLTTVAKNALAGANRWEGRVVYDTDLDALQMWTGAAWVGMLLLTGGTMASNLAHINMADAQVQRAMLKDYGEPFTALTGSTGAVALDYSSAQHYRIHTMAGNVTLSVTNPPPAGNLASMTVRIEQNGTLRTVTFPGAVIPAMQINTTYLFTLLSWDAGVTWTVYPAMPV